MRIDILGSGGAFDDTSTAYLINGEILVDLGVDAIKALIKSGKAGAVRTVFVSHMHSDHINGFETLIYYLRYVTKTEHLLTIYAPRAFKKYMNAHMCMERAAFQFQHVRRFASYFMGLKQRAIFNTAEDQVGMYCFDVAHARLPEAYGFAFRTATSQWAIISGDTDNRLAIHPKIMAKIGLVFHDVGWTGYPDGPHRVHPFEESVFDFYGDTHKIIGIHTQQPLQHYRLAQPGDVFHL